MEYETEMTMERPEKTLQVLSVLYYCYNPSNTAECIAPLVFYSSPIPWHTMLKQTSQA